MATEKKHSLLWLARHTLTYTVVILSMSLVLFPIAISIKYTLLNGIAHGLTDYFTSKLAHRYHNDPRIFYPILGFDQFLHIATLYSSYHYYFVG